MNPPTASPQGPPPKGCGALLLDALDLVARISLLALILYALADIPRGKWRAFVALAGGVTILTYRRLRK
jgi:hypothetical protein